MYYEVHTHRLAHTTESAHEQPITRDRPLATIRATHQFGIVCINSFSHCSKSPVPSSKDIAVGQRFRS